MSNYIEEIATLLERLAEKLHGLPLYGICAPILCAEAEKIRAMGDVSSFSAQAESCRSMLWQPMNTAPKDGTAVLVLLRFSDLPATARWMSGKDANGWHLTWDGWLVPAHDGPRYWMPCPDDPERTT